MIFYDFPKVAPQRHLGGWFRGVFRRSAHRDKKTDPYGYLGGTPQRNAKKVITFAVAPLFLRFCIAKGLLLPYSHTASHIFRFFKFLLGFDGFYSVLKHFDAF